MRVEDAIEALKELPPRAELELLTFSSQGFEFEHTPTGIEYNAHTNTAIIRGA